MKKTIFFLLIGIVLYTNQANAKNMKLKTTIGDKYFTATLNDSDAARKLVQLLPMTMNMGEHNGNEKYYNLPERISGKAINPGRVEAGDLMIWPSSTLVLFYAGSSTSYSYIRLGRVNNVSGLREALGRGSVQVRFELETGKIKNSK